MSFKTFIISKTFFKQLLYALLFIVIFILGVLAWLKSTTNHGEFVVVPDISKKSIREVQQILNDNNLRFEVLDSTNFNPKFPRYSVIEQSPVAGDKVKQNRKIYLTINPSGYREVAVPKVIQITKRNAASVLKAVGLQVGKVTYVNNIGKDMVLSMSFQGEKIQPGTFVPKTSTIDLVCGNGK